MLKERAQKLTVLSSLMEGREKLDTDAIIGKTLTIKNADMVVTEQARYGCVVFKEYEHHYYNTGMVLTKIIDDWLDIAIDKVGLMEVDDISTFDVLQEMLANENVTCRFTKETSSTKTDDGKPKKYVKVEIL